MVAGPSTPDRAGGDRGPPDHRTREASSVGRPRLAPDRRFGSSAREEILDAATELFSEQGFAATSTRAIAAAVGIRQASLYHHFTSKEQILAELLSTTVAPSLGAATALADRPESPESRLWALAAFDVRVLCAGRWNVGALYLLPELRLLHLEAFQRQRQRLRTRYGELLRAGVAHGSLRADDPALATDLVLGLVGSVVHLRQDRGAVEPDLFAPIVADGCLRLLRCDGRRLTAAHRRGAALLAGL
jgi:AcrR family transcriptional regulator